MAGRKQLKDALNESDSLSYRSVSPDPEQISFNFDMSSARPSREKPRKGPEKENANPRQASTNLGPPGARPRARSATKAVPSNKNTVPPKKNTAQAAKSAEQRQPERDASTSKNTQPKKLTGAARRKALTPAMMDIVKYQQSTVNLIPMLPLSRLVREIVQKTSLSRDSLRMTPESIRALREAAEIFITNVFEDGNRITLNRKQVTLQPRDVQLLMLLRGPRGI